MCAAAVNWWTVAITALDDFVAMVSLDSVCGWLVEGSRGSFLLIRSPSRLLVRILRQQRNGQRATLRERVDRLAPPDSSYDLDAFDGYTGRFRTTASEGADKMPPMGDVRLVRWKELAMM